MEGLVYDGKINFLGWTLKKNNGAQTKIYGKTNQIISQRLTEEAQNLINKLFSRYKLQKGWFRIEFLINFRKDSIVMTNVNVGRDGGGMF
ncbi:MAG: hypothetical protein V4501_02860 [Pseudomonadota bacterium]